MPRSAFAGSCPYSTIPTATGSTTTDRRFHALLAAESVTVHTSNFHAKRRNFAAYSPRRFGPQRPPTPAHGADLRELQPDGLASDAADRSLQRTRKHSDTQPDLGFYCGRSRVRTRVGEADGFTDHSSSLQRDRLYLGGRCSSDIAHLGSSHIYPTRCSEPRLLWWAAVTHPGRMAQI